MATEMKRYVVGIVMTGLVDKELELQHHKVQGRSEYEAIGYALTKRSFFKGKIIHIVNAIECEGESICGDNTESLLEAD